MSLPAPAWPNLFIVGAAKAGTTSLYRYLAQHPDIFMASQKEPHFFSQVTPDPAQAFIVPTVTDETAYLDLFRGADGVPWRGEASPSYLWDEDAPARIASRVPEARIIIMLREPVSRAHSHYLMDVREGLQDKGFYQALVEDSAKTRKGWGVSHLYLELGLYGEQVARYYRHFDPARLHVIFFEDFQADTRGALEATLRFLNLDTAPLAAMESSDQHNRYAAPRGRLAQLILGTPALRKAGQLFPSGVKQFVRHRALLRRGEKPTVAPEAAELLGQAYEPQLEQLRDTLGRDLPWSTPP